MNYIEEESCRVCSGNLVSVLDLGIIYASNFVEDSSTAFKAPLELVECEDCGLVQLRHTVNLDEMYVKHYWYKSALNSSMINSLKEIYDRAYKFSPNIQSVLDIGCNDGTLLSFFDTDVFRVGIDPSPTTDGPIDWADLYINDFFPSKELENIGKKFDIITSIAMFYDLPDPTGFTRSVIDLLTDDGIWIIQFTDLVSMLKLNAFDNICHEHLEYYSLTWLCKFFNILGLNVFDCEYNDVNGGSIRLYVDKNVRDTTKRLINAINSEREYLSEHSIKEFKSSVDAVKDVLLGILDEVDDLYILGASTKGNTLLQYYGLDSSRIIAALEINKDKFGLKTVGTDIPIVSEEAVLASTTGTLLVLPWHYREFFLKKLADQMERGWQLIFPLPYPSLYKIYFR